MYIAFVIALLSILPAYYFFRSDLKVKGTPFDNKTLTQSHETVEGSVFSRVFIDDIYTGCVNKFVIGFESPLNLQFNLSKEKWYEKVFKKIGLITEYQTGDEYFDTNVYIASDVEFLHELIHDSPLLRDMILQVLKLDFNCKYKQISIKNRYKMIWVEIDCKAKIKPKKFDVTEMIAPVQGLLTRIRDELEKKADEEYKEEVVFKKSFFLQKVVSALYAMTLVLLISSSFVIWPSIVKMSDLFIYLFPVSFLMVVSLMMILIKKYMKSSWTHKTIGRYFLILFLFSLLPMYTVLKLINTSFDTSPLVSKKLIVRDRHKTSRSPRYYLHVDSWNNNKSMIELRVPGRLYNSKVVSVDLHHGFLDVEWISNIESLKRQ